MDLKFTKKRISEHFAYDWTKYIALIVACVFAVSLFYNMFSRRLTDKEELKVVFFGTSISKLENTYSQYMKDNSLKYSTQYVDTVVEYFAAEEDIYAQKAATVKIESELIGAGMGADIVVLPMVIGLFDENGTWIDDEGNIVGGSFLDENGELKDFAPYSFDYRVGRNYFIPIDEVLSVEIEKGNVVAVELKAKLDANDYYYNTQRMTLDDQTPKRFFDTPVNVINNKPLITQYGGKVNISDIPKIQRANFGISLNKLDVSKTSALINDGVGEQNVKCNYVIGIRRESSSHADALTFLSWFIDTYSK